MNLILKSGLQAAGLAFAAAAIVVAVGSLVLLAYRVTSVLGEGPGLLAGVSVVVFLLLWAVLYAAARE